MEQELKKGQLLIIVDDENDTVELHCNATKTITLGMIALARYELDALEKKMSNPLKEKMQKELMGAECTETPPDGETNTFITSDNSNIKQLLGKEPLRLRMEPYRIIPKICRSCRNQALYPRCLGNGGIFNRKIESDYSGYDGLYLDKCHGYVENDLRTGGIVMGQMDEKTIAECKAKIDVMSREDMARLWRLAPAGHPYFDSTTPLAEYFNARFQSLGGWDSGLSKKIGWGK